MWARACEKGLAEVSLFGIHLHSIHSNSFFFFLITNTGSRSQMKLQIAALSCPLTKTACFRAEINSLINSGFKKAFQFILGSG